MHEALALLAADDPASWIEVVVVLIFLLGGMVRSIAKAVKGERKPVAGKRQRAETTSAPGRLDESGRLEGFDRWEELLRGEAPAPAPAPERRPTPAARRVHRPLPEPDLPTISVEPELAHLPSERELPVGAPEPELVHLPSTDRAMPDEDQLAKRRDEVQERVPDTFVADEIGATALRMGVARDAARERARWQRAIVDVEVLGRPVALRGPEGGPVGLRD